VVDASREHDRRPSSADCSWSDSAMAIVREIDKAVALETVDDHEALSAT
jgi:hypothetical protein